MSCVQLDGSHTRCRQKGESTGYQARKKAVTTNSIFLCDNKGQMIAMGSPKAGNHNDLYEIEEVLKEILALLEEAGIEHKGLFLNADAGFDSKSLREFLESKEIITNIKMESNQMFILMKNCTKIGLKLNKQMVGLTDIKV